MLQFDESFFDKEMMDGFVVSEIMKRVWAASLEMLRTIIDICEKYQIKYYLYYGSLLGAVRHKGFIPWDDDIDIIMKKEDYIKFLSIAESVLPKDYCILNVYSQDGFENPFTKITNGDSVEGWESRMKDYYDCPIVVGIDIFPFYYIPRDKKLEEEQQVLLKVLGQLGAMLEQREKMEQDGVNADAIFSYSKNIAIVLSEFQNLTGLQVEKGKNVKNQLGILYDQISRIYSEEDAEELTFFPCYMGEGHKVNKRLLEETIEVPFENMSVVAPAAYDEILKDNYNDYMIPDKYCGGHAPNFFKGQLGDIVKTLCLSEVNFFDGAVSISEEWEELLYYSNEQGERTRKKVVLYELTWVEMLTNGISMDKVRNILDFFEKRKDVLFWWFVEPLKAEGEEIINRIAPRTFGEYQQLVTEYCRKSWGIYDDSCLVGRAITHCDIYYGDRGEMGLFCEKNNKEVVFQSYEDASVDSILCEMIDD